MKRDDAEPPLNAAIEDLLAVCQTPADMHLALYAWMRLGAERMARECGLSACLETLHSLRSQLRDSQPTRDWPK